MRSRAAVLCEMELQAPFVESKPLEIAEVVVHPPGPRELLVRVGAAGLCHSDLSVIDGTRPRPLPMVLGHEAAGEVVQTGVGVTRFAKGDHVVLSFVPSCGDCPPCAAGRAALCEPAAAANAAGTLLCGERRLERDGAPLHHHLGVSAFSEHIVVSDRSAIAIDPRLSFTVAALFGCAVLTGVGAVLNSATVGSWENVAVFGLGGVGLAALLGARVAGARSITVVDRVREKLELARSLGATGTVLAGEDAAEQVRELTRGGADKVIETVGDERVLAQAYAATRRGGVTVTTGLPSSNRMLSISALSLVAEERTLRGSYLGSCVPSRDIPRLVALHREGRLPVEALLTHRMALEDINAGFDRLARGDAVRQSVEFVAS